MWYLMVLQRIHCLFTLNIQDEALPDGDSQRLMGDDACKLFPRVAGRSCEVEERRHRVGLVQVVFVTRQQSVLEHCGELGPHPLA